MYVLSFDTGALVKRKSTKYSTCINSFFFGWGGGGGGQIPSDIHSPQRKHYFNQTRTTLNTSMYKSLSEIRSENILSVLNEMQFTDRKVKRSAQTVRIVKTLTRHSGNEMQLSDCIRTKNCLYDPYGS